jgi:hypothetical protein
MLSEVAVDAIAAYRLTRFAQRDTFPPMAAVRDRVNADGPDWLAELVGCPWCLSIWVSVGVVVARRVIPQVWQPAAAALTASAVTGLLLTQIDEPG